MVAQEEHTPGVDTALGDLGQGEDDEQDQEAVAAQTAQGVAPDLRGRDVPVSGCQGRPRIGGESPGAPPPARPARSPARPSATTPRRG